MGKLALLLGLMVVGMCLLTDDLQAQDDQEAGETISYSIPPMRVIDVEGTAPSLTLSAPSEAGSAITEATSNDSWLNYTNVVAEGETNKITVAISGASVPAGTTLKVIAASHAGSGDGEYGTPTTEVTLSTSPQDIITAIGSCWTGDGAGNGHQLTYTWSVDTDNYSNAVAAEGSDITATYTIVASL